MRDSLGEGEELHCIQCAYCMPCPNGINILHDLEIFDQRLMDDSFDPARQRRRGLEASAGQRPPLVSTV